MYTIGLGHCLYPEHVHNRSWTLSLSGACTRSVLDTVFIRSMYTIGLGHCLYPEHVHDQVLDTVFIRSMYTIRSWTLSFFVTLSFLTLKPVIRRKNTMLFCFFVGTAGSVDESGSEESDREDIGGIFTVRRSKAVDSESISHLVGKTAEQLASSTHRCQQRDCSRLPLKPAIDWHDDSVCTVYSNCFCSLMIVPFLFYSVLGRGLHGRGGGGGGGG